MTTTTATANTTAATTNYTHSLNDLSAWTNIISMQTQTGLSTTYNNASCAAFANWTFFFTSNKVVQPGAGGIQDNIPVYSLITNADLLKWMNDLFTQLLQLQVPAFSIAYSEAFTAYLRKALSNQTAGLNPVNVAGWGTSILSTSAKWGANVPAKLQNVDLNNADTWSNPARLPSALSVLWTDQWGALKTLSQRSELTSEQCIYLMYLLCSLASGTLDQQNSVDKIASAPCNAMELANSNFITSLVYYNLMLLADPMGAYTQTNPQIQRIVNSLIPAITGTDAGSVAIKAGLSTQAKILKAAINYPMIDPYNSSIGFPTRQLDMLDAINTTWAQQQGSF